MSARPVPWLGWAALRRAVLVRLIASYWPYLPVWVGPLVLLAPFLAGLQVFYWGTPLLQFFPWRYLALETLRSGEWPLWNPYLGTGAPLLANYQTAVFYPPNWLGWLMPLEYAFSWLVALHLAWAGTGMVTLARSLGLRPFGQAIAGLAFGLSQYLVARAGFFSINAAVAWLPWVVWSVDGLVRLEPAGASLVRRARLALVLAALVALQLLAGHAQTTWYTLLLAAAWALWRLLAPGRGWPWRAQTAALLGAAVLLGVALAAIQLLPTAELMLASSRAEAAEYEFVMTYSFSPWRLLTLLAPDLLGNPARGVYYGYGNYWEDAIYVGTLPLLLALGLLGASLGRIVLLRRARGGEASALPRFLLIVAAASLLIGLGRKTPVFPFLYHNVPTFDLFQAPTRIMVGFVFALALLAGLGAERWRAPQGRALYWTRLGTAGMVALLVTGTAALYFVPGTGAVGQQIHTLARAVIASGAILLVAGLLSLLRPKDSAPAWWQAAVVVFVAADLIYAGWGLNPGAPDDLYRQPTATGQPLAQALAGQRLFQFPDDEYRVKYEQLLGFESFGPPGLAQAAREAQVANVALLDGLASANNFDPLVTERYAGLMQVISTTRSLDLLRLMDVGVIASSEPLDLEVVAEAPDVGVRFYRLPGPAQRVRVVYSAEVVPDAAAALAAVSAPDFDAAEIVILEAGTPESSPPGERRSLSLTPGPSTYTIAVTLAQPGWVVLADAYYPGWHAYVDGQPVPVLPANYAFRAVAVEAGDHEISFVYRPRSFALGLWITGASALGWLLAAVLLRRGRERTDHG